MTEFIYFDREQAKREPDIFREGGTIVWFDRSGVVATSVIPPATPDGEVAECPE